MRLTFLCPTHRDWVYFHPEQALEHLENAQCKGESLMCQHQWEQAIPFLGCAFESVEILIELQGTSKAFLVSRLTSLAILLADCMNNLQVNDYSEVVLKQAMERLKVAADLSYGNKPKLAFLQECIHALRNNQLIIKNCPQPYEASPNPVFH